MKYPMTPRSYRFLREELQRLKGSRPELANAIEVARGHGDLSENADYDAAKERSGMVEAKIRDIEAKLSMAQVIDPREISDLSKAVFGLTIEIEEIESGDRRRVTLVGADESDISKGRLSFESPLGRALIGKEVGDTTKVRLPAGEKEYEILAITVDYQDEGTDPATN